MNALAGLLLAAQLAINGQTPVDVTTCSSQITNNGQFAAASLLTIDFTNTSARTIKSVTFGVSAGNQPEAQMTDAGTFTTGTPIRHTFTSPISNVTQPRCVVRSVTFSDGDEWVASPR
jgi:hypothetical protein